LKLGDIVAGNEPPNPCNIEVKRLSSFLPKLDIIVRECLDWYEGWVYDEELNPYKLTKDESLAVVMYTHDLKLHASTKGENFYFQLNEMFRRRMNNELEQWKGYLYYLMTALKKFPDKETIVYRGIPKSAEEKLRKEYKKNRPIHWSGLSSATEDISIAKSFTDINGILFKIHIYEGKAISNYSFAPSENEILLSPNMKFRVVSELFRDDDGYLYIVLEQEPMKYIY